MRTARVLIVGGDTRGCFPEKPLGSTFGTENFGFGVVHVSASDPRLTAKIRGRFYRAAVVHILPWELPGLNALKAIRAADNEIPIISVLAQGLQELALYAAEKNSTICIPESQYTTEKVTDQVCTLLCPEGKRSFI